MRVRGRRIGVDVGAVALEILWFECHAFMPGGCVVGMCVAASRPLCGVRFVSVFSIFSYKLGVWVLGVLCPITYPFLVFGQFSYTGYFSYS
jgi:hypothetical protein